ncbi:hypothetical protein AVEN_140136-1, partial [Araneus ventricosus]
MGLDFFSASTGGMVPEFAHKTLESQFRLSLFTANDDFFIIEVLWVQIVISVKERKFKRMSLVFRFRSLATFFFFVELLASLLHLVLLTSAFFNCHRFHLSSSSSFSFFIEMLIFHWSATLGNLVACQHLRAYEFFIYSFNPNGCLFVGVECTSWPDFLEGHCNCGHEGEKCAIMGMFSPTYAHPTGKHYRDRRMYLKVGPERPFC